MGSETTRDRLPATLTVRPVLLVREDHVIVVEEPHANRKGDLLRVIDSVAHPPSHLPTRKQLVIRRVEAFPIHGLPFGVTGGDCASGEGWVEKPYYYC